MPLPFSAKKKKAQLAAKRNRLREDGTHLQNTEHAAAEEVPEHPPSETTRDHVSVPTLDARQSQLVSVFAKLSKSEMHGRKLRAQQPFQRVPQSALEIGFETLYRDPSKVITFPRRPPWFKGESKERVESREKIIFEQWLQSVYSTWNAQDLSYFEHNLEVWRQLWRVVEISDIVLFVVDARHPVLHFPPTLFDYVVTKMKKKLVLVFNKIDLIDAPTLEAWIRYFESRYPGLHTASFSIYPPEAHLQQPPPHASTSNPQSADIQPYTRAKLSKRVARYIRAVGVSTVLKACRDVELFDSKGVAVDWEAMIRDEEEVKARRELEAMQKRAVSAENEVDEVYGGDGGGGREGKGGRRERLRREREQMLSSVETNAAEKAVSSETSDSEDDAPVEKPSHEEENDRDPRTDMITIGLIGHPNVGKSSLINGIVGRKVVSTSSTPGHTKHFQTIHLNKTVRLCDCPGLVFPAVLEKPVQILSGMYKIAQVQEPYSAVQYLAERIPVEKILHLEPPLVSTGVEDAVSGSTQFKAEHYREALQSYKWSAWDICEAFAIQRGFLTPKVSRPDVYRAANLLLRMANDGRLLLGFKPPGYFAERAAIETQQMDRSREENTEKVGIDNQNLKKIGRGGKKQQQQQRRVKEAEGDSEDDDAASPSPDHRRKDQGRNAFALLALDDD
ncbi:Guanine nucleotide-binding-like protein 1 [Chytriomyces hyalinus]|nr:Guanine nucleotide-binding-like protein 1 [Chytriomyces hyalinus]